MPISFYNAAVCIERQQNSLCFAQSVLNYWNICSALLLEVIFSACQYSVKYSLCVLFSLSEPRYFNISKASKCHRWNLSKCYRIIPMLQELFPCVALNTFYMRHTLSIDRRREMHHRNAPNIVNVLDWFILHETINYINIT